MSKCFVWFFAGLILHATAGAAAAWTNPWKQEAVAAVRGEEIARKEGCFTCHGAGGRGGIKNPGSAGGEVPGWDGATMAMYVRSDKELYDWVLQGAPKRLRSAPDYAATKGVIPMPAYKGSLSGRDLDDLVAYIRAVAGTRRKMPDVVYEGRRIAVRMGCFGCHGPSGMGGGPNPGSFKGYIPSLTGSDFEELVRDEKELRDWILEGRIPRLWKNPLARRYLARQRVQMPAYRDHLSEVELKQLIDYIRWLRKQ